MHSQNVSSTRKKAGTCALEPHTLSPKALGRHPVFRHGKVRQPDVFPGALGHRALSWSHTQSWPEPAAGSISKQATRIPGFVPTACPAPCSQAAPWNTCCTAFPRHEGCLWLLSRSSLLPENRSFPAAAVPSTGQAQRHRGRLWLSHDDVLSLWSKYQDEFVAVPLWND